MNNPNETDLITQGQPVAMQKTLDALPGLVGAIDRALFDQTGEKRAFVLLIFAEGGAMHATNIHPPIDAVTAVQQLAESWKTAMPTEHA